jgi:hypothetical protein
VKRLCLGSALVVACTFSSHVHDAEHDSNIYVDLYLFNDADRQEIIVRRQTMTEEERFQNASDR